MTGVRQPAAPCRRKQVRLSGERSHRGRYALWFLTVLLPGAVLVALLAGPSSASLAGLVRHLHTDSLAAVQASRDYIVLVEIRLPRIVLGALIGAALAVSGVLMQGLFRNPLADPGIMGVSSGAALGAIGFIVLGSALPADILALLGPFGLVAGAFFGGLAVAVLLYAIATHRGQTSIATMLLAGIAIAALSGAILGMLIFMADDRQLRDISFWSLGSLAGATWWRVAVAGPFILVSLFLACFLARALNVLSLGETVAGHLGFSVQSIKNYAVIFISLMCGAAVSVSGAIGFVGIVVPHLLRLTIGPDHRYLLACSALIGASLLVLADSLARIAVAPAELPIGIVTAAFGAPFFLWILLRRRAAMNL